MMSPLSSSAKRGERCSCGKPFFIPANLLLSDGAKKSSQSRLKALQPDRIPSLRFGVRSLDDGIGGFKPHDLAVLYGSRHAVNLSHMLAVRVQLPLGEYGLNSSVLFIDAGCSFDPHSVSSFAQLQGMFPKDVLERIYVSRAFTLYQLLSLVYDWLPRAIEEYDARLVVVSSILELFTDLDVPRDELLMSFSRLSRSLSNLALKKEAVVLVTVPSRCDSWRSNQLFSLLKSRADIIAELKEKKSCLRLILERHIRRKTGIMDIPLSPLKRGITLQDFLEVKRYG
ncbi:MAG: hypothetical protein JSW01_05495 [Candidatus Bathyarchaeota archaeon]|nr:MAG: hypothetical protein JSW01_05495 [Candidatus Bathyarchaeota archaeon]